MSQEAQLPNRPNLSTPEDVAQRVAIDKTTRLPVLFFFTSAAVWLLVSLVLGLIASVKIYAPHAWASEWLAFERTHPAFLNALTYGWGMQAGFGVMIWIMARLCRTELKNPITVVVAGHFWNLGVTIGVVGILSGYARAAKGLEFMPQVWPILLVSYVLITIWMVIMFQARRKGHVFISQWYILTACFTFPWAYLTANAIINSFGQAGVMGPVTASWFAGTHLYLWFVPVGLATAYFIIPKIVGKPIHSYHLSQLAFWGVLALGGWVGVQDLMGGPIPAWMPAVSGTAQVLLLVPVIAIGFNHYNTVGDSHGLVAFSPALRFTFFGAIGLSVAATASALFSTQTFSRYAQFTFASDGLRLGVLLMFFTMMMFGAIYFIVPRVTGCEWLDGKRIRFHFWFTSYGVITLVVLPLAGGLFYGSAVDHWDRSMEGPLRFGNGFVIGSTLAFVFVLLATISFFRHLILMVTNKGRVAGRPARIHEPEVDHAELVMTHEGAESA